VSFFGLQQHLFQVVVGFSTYSLVLLGRKTQPPRRFSSGQVWLVAQQVQRLKSRLRKGFLLQEAFSILRCKRKQQ